jgi:uncharacterized repeat protein (TIGR02543 family)
VTPLGTSGQFTVPASTTYYALWTGDQITIHFDWNNDIGIVNQETGAYGSPTTPTTVPFYDNDPTDYSFTSWCSVQENPNIPCSGVTIDPSSATFPLTPTYFYALYTGNNEAIDFDANGGTGGATVDANYDTTADLPAAPTYANYTFEGWCTTQESPNTSCPVTPLGTSGQFTVPASTTYYALWRVVPRFGGAAPVNNDSISFVVDGGEPVAPITTANGSTVTLPTPTYSGHSFLGWYTTRSGGNLISSPFTVTNPVTVLYAQWSSANTAAAVFTRVTVIHAFADGSSILTALEKRELRALVTRLNGTGDKEIRLVGETPVPSTATSRHLALARDTAVKNYLVGLGVKVPFIEGTTALGTAASSRVVVVYVL